MRRRAIILLKIYSLIVGFLAGRGLGKFRLVATLHQYFSRMLIPKKDVLFSINGKDSIFIHGSQFTGMLGGLSAHGVYEKYETSLFKRFVKQGMNVVDAGANIGYYTLLAVKLVGDDGKVFAFEPEPENYSLLLKNVDINGYKNVIVLQKAVSNKTEKKRLILSEEDPSGHSFCNLDKEKGSIMVDAVSLDDFFEKQKLPIDVIKMDIEGAEMLALLGMEKIIETNDN